MTDDNILSKLNSEKTVKVYRAMQVIDGKLYPPMAASVGKKLVDPIQLGKWEQADEHPELIKVEKNAKGEEVYKFVLDKGGKDATGKDATKVPAAYNPYIHTSRSILNDQFKSAWIRPNLVTVEVEVPVSELTSGYKAQYAKDSVGECYPHTRGDPQTLVKNVINDKNLSAEKLAVIEQLDDIVEDAEYVGSGSYVQHGSKNKDTVRFDYFERDINIDGRPYVVAFDVEVFPSTNNYRTHKVVKEISLTDEFTTDMAPEATAMNYTTSADVAPEATAKEVRSDFADIIIPGQEKVKLSGKPYNKAFEENNNSNKSIRHPLSEDSTGKPLTEGQKRYFKDSKAADENGNLKVMYHGTPSEDFTVFGSTASQNGIFFGSISKY